jgi:hypothetical protein
VEPEDCRKLGQNLTNIYHEKQKQAKVIYVVDMYVHNYLSLHP